MMIVVDEAELARRGDENLASAWTTLVRSMGGDVSGDGPLVLVASGLPIAFFNGGFVAGSISDPERTIADAVAFFGARSLPFLLWVRDGLAPDLVAAASATGLRPQAGPPLMALSPVPPMRPLLDGLSVEVVADEASLADHARLLTEAFEMPREVGDRFIRPALLETADFAVVIGRVDGEPVSTAAVAVSGSTAGVYNVATPKEFRGKGFGETLTDAAIREGVRRGCDHAILQASPAGYPVYLRMGFVEIARYTQLEGPPT